MNGAYNPPAAPAGRAGAPPAGAFDYRQWRAITERALATVRAQHAQVSQELRRVQRDVERLGEQAARLDGEIAFLERALALDAAAPDSPTAAPSGPAPALPGGAPRTPEALPLPLPLPLPPPMKKGSRSGVGVGGRAGMYLLEVARIRTQVQAEQRTGRPHGAPVDLAQDGAGALTHAVIRLACKGWASSTITVGLRRLVADGYLTRTSPGVYALTEYGVAAGPRSDARLPLTDPGANGDPAPTTLTRVGEPPE
jgi:hypothetical protein